MRDTEIEPKFRSILKIPDKYRVICSVAVGYPGQTATRTREPLETLVSYETFGGER